MILELTPDQKAYQQTIAAFAGERVAPIAATIDEEGTFPRALIKEAATLGLLGVTIPRASGGAGRDYVSYALALEALGRASAVVSVIVSVNNSLVVEPIAEFGAPARRRSPAAAARVGRGGGAFALSEPSAGSDAANQQTTARPLDGGYVLNGRKVWVANAEAADVAIVFAATLVGFEAVALLRQAQDGGCSAFLVPFETPGLTRVVREDSLGVRGLGCMDLELADVRVGAEAMLGATGDGFQIAMWALDGGRVAIAAQALGVGEAALEAAIAHAKQHSALGQPIATTRPFSGSGRQRDHLDAARLLTMKAADARQRRARATLEAAMAKLSASEAAHRAADRAMRDPRLARVSTGLAGRTPVP